MAEELCLAFDKAWSSVGKLHGPLRQVSKPAPQPVDQACSAQCVLGHYEFNDGARFFLRFTDDKRDNMRTLLLEDDIGLHRGFLDDINAYLLDYMMDAEKKPSDALIAVALEKAWKMHSREPSTSTTQPRFAASLADFSKEPASQVKPEEHPLAAMLSLSRSAMATQVKSAATAPQEDAAEGGDAASEDDAATKKRKEGSGAFARTFGSSTIASTTLMKQLQILQKQDTRAEGFLAAPVEDDLYTWKVQLFFDDPSTPLCRDLRSLEDRDCVELEFKFPSSYPCEPPVVRFIAPSMVGGFVTQHGAICMELFTGSGWSPVNSIDLVCIQIRAMLLSGNARIDMKNPMGVSRYSLAGAMRDLHSIVNSHRWTLEDAKKSKRPRANPNPAK